MVGIPRQLLAVALLPFAVTVLVPWWLACRAGIAPRVAATLPQVLTQVAGLALLAVGGLLFVASLRHLAGAGCGTLAPWDPPRRLVVRGPYRYVRNPMISGVGLLLLGEAAALLSRAHLTWALLFLGVNALQIPLVEEPALRKRFGEAYREYCRHVPRLVPRVRPWDP